MALSAFLSVAALMAMGTPSAADGCVAGWQPTPQDISKIEASLQLRGKYQLSDYDRYYTGACVDRRQTIQGVFLLAQAFRLGNKPLSASAGSFHIVNSGQLPLIADGGCAVIDFTVNAADITKASARCHGFG